MCHTSNRAQNLAGSIFFPPDWHQEIEDVIAEVPGTESEIGALSNMGVCLAELGRWRDAVGAYDRVIGMFEEKRATRDAFQFAKAHRDWIVSARL